MADSEEEKRRQRQQLLEASSLGLMFPIAIGIGFGIGWWLDHLFHSWPWMTSIFSAFGMIAAFINLFRTGMRDGGSSSNDS